MVKFFEVLFCVLFVVAGVFFAAIRLGFWWDKVGESWLEKCVRRIGIWDLKRNGVWLDEVSDVKVRGKRMIDENGRIRVIGEWVG